MNKPREYPQYDYPRNYDELMDYLTYLQQEQVRYDEEWGAHYESLGKEPQLNQSYLMGWDNYLCDLQLGREWAHNEGETEQFKLKAVVHFKEYDMRHRLDYWLRATEALNPDAYFQLRKLKLLVDID